jgi:DNA replication licensing factor MCM2
MLAEEEDDDEEGVLKRRGDGQQDGDDDGDGTARARRRETRPAPKRRKMLYDEPSETGGEDATATGAETLTDQVDEEAPVGIGLEHIEGNLREWLTLEVSRREVAAVFRRFLLTYRDPRTQALVYHKGITRMCSENKESLPVSFVHLSAVAPALSSMCAEEPVEVLKIFDEVARQVTLRQFREYRTIAQDIHVRITDLPIADTVRDLRQYHLNRLIKVSGVVTRRTSVYPQLVLVRYDCPGCRFVIGPFATSDASGPAPAINACPNCHSRGPFSVNAEQTLYRNYQKITLQESPGSVPPGRLPRSKEVILLYDLIDSCKPGEEVEVIGIYRHSHDLTLNRSHGFPVFSTVIEANNVVKRDDLLSSFRLTEEDERRIRELASDPQILERVAASIAPSIYGHSDIKMALALALFGGQTHVLMEKGQHRIRGDINVLLLGDPGQGKSQFLKYIEKTSHRAIFTTGKGSTAVGLTAAVHKDAVTREWTLEGGALVLADRGICLIDEFDKMNDKDRTSIHEAMEQQSISISKAGIVTTLQARCAVIAAANPVKGRYDASLPFRDNVELTEPILSRFDILLVVRDIVNPVADENLARFVVQSHVMSHPLHKAQRKDLGAAAAAVAYVDDTNLIPQDLLRKYIVYARNRLEPKWISGSQEFDKLSTIYADMRQEAEKSGGFPICMRHVESAMRMAEACARIHLREAVQSGDMNLAIRMMLESFINTHKYSVARLLEKRFKAYLTFCKDHNDILYHLLTTLVRERSWMLQRQEELGESGGGSASSGGVSLSPDRTSRLEIDREDFEARAQEYGISDCRSFFKSSLFLRNGFEAKDKVITKRFA